MAEFKRLSDVEVVAELTKSANVLIEEDGVIKKAPKTAVGGNSNSNSDSNSNWDAVITLSLDGNEYRGSCELTSGNYNSLLSQIQNGEVPNVLITGQWSYGDTYDIAGKSISCYYSRAEGRIMIDSSFLWYRITFRLASDGTLSIDR